MWHVECTRDAVYALVVPIDDVLHTFPMRSLNRVLYMAWRAREWPTDEDRRLFVVAQSFRISVSQQSPLTFVTRRFRCHEKKTGPPSRFWCVWGGGGVGGWMDVWRVEREEDKVQREGG